MAKVILQSGETYTAASPATIYGSTGVDIVKVLEGVSVTLDASVERVEFAQASNTFTYKATPTGVQVLKGGAVVANVTNGQKLAFSDGSAMVSNNFDPVTLTVNFMIGGSKVTAAGGSLALTLNNTAGEASTLPAGATVSGGGASTPAPPATPSLNPAQFSLVNAGVGTSLPLGNTLVSSLVTSDKWTSAAVTYSFNTSVPAEYAEIPSVKETPSGTLTTGWSALNDAEKGAARQAFANLASLIPLSFTEVAGNAGDIRFNVLPMTGTTAGFAYSPAGNWAPGGDVFLSDKDRSAAHYSASKDGYVTVTHELGHAMGLKHPFEQPNILDKSLDNLVTTVMSYTSGRTLMLNFTVTDKGASWTADYNASPSSFSLLDVAALQAMYGVNTGYRTGENSYSVSFAQHQYLTIWDAGGSDVLDCSAVTGACTVDLRPGQFSSMDVRSIADQKADSLAYYHSQGINWADSMVAEAYARDDIASKLYTGENNVGIAHGVWLENVKTGSAADTVRDNAVNNVVSTGAGNDLIQLFDGGYDTVDGGAGTDTVQVKDAKSLVQTEKQADGSFLVVGSYFAAKLIGVEKLLFSDGDMALA